MHISLSTMAPIKDEAVDALKELVHKLQARVEQLESRLHGDGKGSTSRSQTGNLRLILIGPPGAGTGLLKRCNNIGD